MIGPLSRSNSGNLPTKLVYGRNTHFRDVNNHKKAEHLLISLIALQLRENKRGRTITCESSLIKLELHIVVNWL